MEDLTKQQMVLLTVLVSFVSSVATSIMIVALLTDSTPAVSRTITNVIEKTIEKVVTGTTTPIYVKPTPAPILSESEKVINAVQDNLSKIVIIRSKDKEGESATSTSKLGIGTIVSSDGIIATDSSIAGERTEFIINIGDKYRRAKKVYSNDALHLVFIKAEDPIKDDKNTAVITFSPVAYYTGETKLGQSVVILGGENGKSIMKDILTDIPSDKTLPFDIGTSVIPASYKGGIVFGQDGKVVGFILSSDENKAQVIHYSNILSALAEYKIPKPEPIKP